MFKFALKPHAKRLPAANDPIIRRAPLATPEEQAERARRADTDGTRRRIRQLVEDNRLR
jgi:hypothetical protein